MDSLKHLGWTLLTFGLLQFGVCTHAHAYLDAGSTSLIIQGLVGGIVSVLVVLKMYWVKFKCFLFGEQIKEECLEEAPKDENSTPKAE